MPTIKNKEILVPGRNLVWRCHTPGLLQEILNNPGTGILKRPLQIFAGMLEEVATRAAELNDPKLNALMCRLTLYAISDPYEPEYDKDVTDKIISKFY